MEYIIGTLLVVLDQLTKIIAKQRLKSISSVRIIPHIINFTYVENTGIAFGMFKNMYALFIPLSLIIIAVIIFLSRKFLPKTPAVYRYGAVMLVSGAIGNLIDKTVRGYVIDFIEFGFFRFPVFNVADILVCLGAVIVCYYVIFKAEEKK